VLTLVIIITNTSRTSMKGHATIQGVQSSAEMSHATLIMTTAQRWVLRTRYLSGRVTHMNRSKLINSKLATDALLTV